MKKQILAIYRHGLAVFGKEKFRRWLDSNIIALRNETPRSWLDTPERAEHVDNILGRIEHGIYS